MAKRLSRSASVMRDNKGQLANLRKKQSRNVVREPNSWTQAPQHSKGLADSVMMEKYEDPEAFMANLKVRFENKLIYTYIRGVCVSVNPYQDLGIYNPALIDEYYATQLFELPPHIYAIANQAYYAMKEENTDQCILISGESGAGKTESAKQILQFLAACAIDTGISKQIRDRLLMSNPILEACGNAKTTRNDNSSRFGKYMEIEFDFKGEPCAGRIINYLLEKSRVVNQLEGERNYHIFYMAIAGADAGWKANKGLTKDHLAYHYTSRGKVKDVAHLDDADEWKIMRDAMSSIGINDQECDVFLDVIVFVLLLGEVQFDGSDAVKVSGASQSVLAQISKLTGVSPDVLADALTHKTIVTGTESVKSPLNNSQGIYARDALAKSVYDRTFSWLVRRLNKALAQESKGVERHTVMGLLDIYGFEILQTNGFEQVCINYCNEKLQQLFIELTLKMEQEEYRKEGIKWVPIEYFNNEIICQLIESATSPYGLISLLDDICLAPGDKVDADFLAVMDTKFKGHNHYASFNTSKSVKRDCFVIKHYAGDVTYTIDEFLDKNNDLLYRDLKGAMLSATNAVITDIFDKKELDMKKRPQSAGTQFRQSMQSLMKTLMAKSPSYVRCIKPNESKSCTEWDADMISHQIKYLGLMENLRVARAGYCFRRPFAHFLKRFKSLCPQTWPHWKGDLKEGVTILCNHLNLPEGEIAIGNTKVFIRNPATVAQIEKMYQDRKPHLVTKIKAIWKGHVQRQRYLKMKAAAIVAQTHARVFLAQIAAEKRRKAVGVVREFIGGFIKRNDPITDVNRKFVTWARVTWLKKLANRLPSNLLENKWIRMNETPPYLDETSKLLQKMCRNNIARKYRLKLSAKDKAILTQKLACSEIFKDKKDSYPFSVAEPFVTNRIDDDGHNSKIIAAYSKVRGEGEGNNPIYVTQVAKIDRSNFKHNRDDYVVLTNSSLHILTTKFKHKFSCPLSDMQGVSVSDSFDGIVVIHTPGVEKDDKGDFVFDTPHVFEFVTALKSQRKDLPVNICQQITFNIPKKPSKMIVFTLGDPEPSPYATIKLDGVACLQVTSKKLESSAGFVKQMRQSLRRRAVDAEE